MAHFHIALVEPEIPQNTGNIARTCAATGCGLHLIKPLGFEVSDKQLKRAGLDYWDKLSVTYYDNLAAFSALQDGAPMFYFTTKAPRRYTDVSYPDGSVLVFGKETAGLPEEFLRTHPERCVRIPMRPTLRSLNLSNAVAIALFEVLRQWDFEGLQDTGSPRSFSWEDTAFGKPKL